MILGVGWLETLGEVKTNWKKQIMSCEKEGKIIILEGAWVDDSNPSMALQEILREEKGKQIDTPPMELEVQQEQELQELLQKYSKIFQEPQGLPPKRRVEHAINLKLGVELVNVRPYKYAYHHKDEIKKQVNALLQAGATVLALFQAR